MPQRIPPEVALTIACCRWPRSAERSRAICEAAEAVTDWPQFERHVERHRVARLARDGLTHAGVAVPSDVEERLTAHSAVCAFTALAMARESVRLQRAFAAAGIPALIIKGAAMGALAYGDPCMKESWDIDLLTSADALQAAHALLGELHYDLYLPGPMSPIQFQRYARVTLEAGYKHRQRGFTVELHWRVTPNTHLIPDVTVHSASQAVRVAGAELLTFSDDVLFAYLCVHGTQHAWARLKWVADIGAFLATREPAEVERMYAAAGRAGAGRTARVSLLLCRRLLGTPIPAAIVSEVERDPMARILEAVALHYIYRRQAPANAVVIPPSLVFLSQFFLAAGAGYFFEQIVMTWIRPFERAKYGFAAHFLRIPLWLGRVVRRMQGRGADPFVGAVGR
jgi:hypothetical protein